MLKIQTSRKGPELHAKLKGALDESAAKALTGIRAGLDGLHVVFDCSGLTAVNSIGFRAWARFLKDLEKGATFAFTACPQPFVEFCNVLPTLAFADRIKTLGVPYTCDACRARTAPVYDATKLSPERPFEVIICKSCNGTMRADTPSESYLGFMLDQP